MRTDADSNFDSCNDPDETDDPDDPDDLEDPDDPDSPNDPDNIDHPDDPVAAVLFLSERTSAVSPVIFLLVFSWTNLLHQ